MWIVRYKYREMVEEYATRGRESASPATYDHMRDAGEAEKVTGAGQESAPFFCAIDPSRLPGCQSSIGRRRTFHPAIDRPYV